MNNQNTNTNATNAANAALNAAINTAYGRFYGKYDPSYRLTESEVMASLAMSHGDIAANKAVLSVVLHFSPEIRELLKKFLDNATEMNREEYNNSTRTINREVREFLFQNGIPVLREETDYGPHDYVPQVGDLCCPTCGTTLCGAFFAQNGFGLTECARCGIVKPEDVVLRKFLPSIEECRKHFSDQVRFPMHFWDQEGHISYRGGCSSLTGALDLLKKIGETEVVAKATIYGVNRSGDCTPVFKRGNPPEVKWIY